MFGLSLRAPCSRKAVTRGTVSLFLERLEDRLTPSGPAPELLGGNGGGGSGSETITLNVTYQPNKHVLLTGHLSNASGPIANQTIEFGGVLNNYYAATNSNGDFTDTLTVPQLGQVTARSADGLSNVAAFTLVGGTPSISNFAATPEGGRIWDFSGDVTGAPTQGETVYFGGIPALQNQSTPVKSGGTFDFFCGVPTGGGGYATAYAVDWWGDTSEEVMTDVNC